MLSGQKGCRSCRAASRVALLKEGSLVVNSSQGGGTGRHLGTGRLKKEPIMLSRTADHLFLDVALHRARRKTPPACWTSTTRPALLPQSAGGGRPGRPAAHQRAHALPEFPARSTAATCVRTSWCATTPTRRASSTAQKKAAGERPRRARRLPTEVWETINYTWLKLNQLLRART